MRSACRVSVDRHADRFEIGDFEPPDWAQLWDRAGGPQINIQGAAWYEPPTWPERPGEQAKMPHFEVEVDDLDNAVATALSKPGDMCTDATHATVNGP